MTLSVRATLLGGGIALVAGAALALAAPLAASAHVGATATSTAAGSSTVVTFSVPHGCDGSPTLVVTIDIPDSVLAVTPRVNPAWTVEKVLEPLEDGAEDSHGNALPARVDQVVYTSTTGGLPEGFRDAFELSLRLPDGAVGDVVAFPTTQTCVEGTAVWEGDDAPAVTLTAATGADDHGHAEEPAGDANPETDHAAEVSGSEPQADVLARALGIGGLVVGAAGLIAALLARRKVRG